LAKLKHVQTPHQAEYYSTLPVPQDPFPAPVTPDNPPFGTLEAMGFWFVSVVLILLIPSFFLLPYLALHDPPIVDSASIVEFAKTDPTSIFLQILAILPAHLLTLGVGWLIVTRGGKYAFRDVLGWTSGGFRWWHYLIILGGFWIVAGGVNAYFPEQENELLRILASSRSAVYIVAFVATFTAPIVEEVVYRGVVYSAFQKKFGVAAAFVFATLLFAVVHVPQYYPSYSTIFLLFILSLTLTSIRVKTGNLLPCIVLHTLFNGLQSLLLLLEPYFQKDQALQDAAKLMGLWW
jgi:membrane protease YdiL (CAAX protease family)